MKIGIDIRVLGTGRTSGVEEYTRQLLAHMLPLDKSVTYKLFYSGRSPLVREPWMEASNTSVHEVPRSNRLLFLSTRLIGRPYLDHLIGGVDTFFFPHFLLGATSLGCRRVLTFHDLSYERFPEFFSLGRRAWHRLQMRPRQQAMRADRIIAVSASTSNDIHEIYGIPAERITTIHSGIDSELKRPAEGDLIKFREKNSLPGRYILALGTLEPRKNIEGLIKAFERLASQPDMSDLNLVIIGSAGWLDRPIGDLIKISPYRDRIRLVGNIKNEERVFWLAGASVLVYPSFLEGFGFPPLEAMRCGTPVVASANSSLLETLGDAAILADPYSVDSLSRALTVVLTDKHLRQRLIGHGFDRSKSFDWSGTAQKTLAVLTSV